MKFEARINCIAIFLAVVMCGPASLGLAASNVYSEFEVKTAFLYRALHYIKWDEILQNPDSTLVICTNVSSPRDNLFRSLENQTVINRKIEVQIISDTTLGERCNVVYFDVVTNMQIKSLLGTLRGKKILTVGEQAGFSDAGGVLNLLLIDRRIKFQVNIDAAERQKIKFSAKFLRIAEIIKEH